ncbi:hypothetical protein KBI5_25020, partial [Frankia sp. KB5]
MLGAASTTRAAVVGRTVAAGVVACTGVADDVGTGELGVTVELGVTIADEADRIAAVSFFGGSEVAPMMMNKAIRTVI